MAPAPVHRLLWPQVANRISSSSSSSSFIFFLLLMDPHHHHHHLPLKKPKLEDPNPIPIDDENPTTTTTTTTATTLNGKRSQEEDESSPLEEQEEALLALIAHRTHEVEHNKQRVSYYRSQLEVSERRLRESQSQLARLRSRRSAAKPSAASTNGTGSGSSPITSRPPSRPQLNIPAVNPKNPTPPPAPPRAKASPSTAGTPKREAAISKPSPPPEKKRAKRVFEPKEHQDLIPRVCSSSSPCTISLQGSTHISSQHKRKLRSLVLNPVNDQMFVTSALDGVVNLWQLHSKGHSASLLSTIDCVSPKQRRWPEDITWHPDGDSLFAVYSADGGDSQISVLNLNLSGDKKVTFLQEKPHLKGIINGIIFMPWVDLCFTTGGSDHAVILWNEKDNLWKPKTLHRNQHSSAVMGVAGLQQKKVILSVGADKRIVGFDVLAGRAEFKHQIESKCMSVLPNPSDFNLFMVQTGSPGKQLRLFDIRLRQTEIHAFGWKQESSESQSALINQAWSPDGYYLSSGSADPMIHIFDIRYKSSNPSQSVQAHQKRVFKAVWHRSVPLLTSISSDLNIGLHRIT